MTGFVMDTTTIWASREAERRRHEGAERTSLTQKFTAALASAVTVEAITAAAREGLAYYGANSLVIVTGHEGDAPRSPRTASARTRRGCSPIRSRPPARRSRTRSKGGRGVFPLSRGPAARAILHLALAVAGSAQRAWTAVPVPGANGRLGACLMGFAEPREFGNEECALLVTASGLLAQSLQSARMYESEHALARDLQHGLLPRGPLLVPGVSIAARYQPVTSGLEIGGDFFDDDRAAGGGWPCDR